MAKMINSKLHGKHYYMTLRDENEMNYMKELLNNSEYLSEEDFHFDIDEARIICCSEATCETFRGPLYHEWERIKSYIYRMRRK